MNNIFFCAAFLFFSFFLLVHTEINCVLCCISEILCALTPDNTVKYEGEAGSSLTNEKFCSVSRSSTFLCTGERFEVTLRLLAMKILWKGILVSD